MNDLELDALASGYGLAFICCALIAVAAGIVVVFMRFTPEEIAEGQAAQETAHTSIDPDDLTA
jgi:hypothetical protein